jgi:hypothetical protein
MYEKVILIFGYGKWSQKIIRFLKKSKIFNEIYIRTTSKFFKIYPYKTELKLSEFKYKIKKFKYLHICAPTITHYKIIQINDLNNKKIIIEKPLVQKKVDLNNIRPFFKSNKILVNYIDLYNPLLLNLKRKLKSVKQLSIDFGNNELYLNKYDCLNEWLDHPLAIILRYFKKFSNFQIIYYKNIRLEKKYFEKLHLSYHFKNINIDIRLNINFPKSYRTISKKEKSIYTKVNLKLKPKKLKMNSIKFLYDDLKRRKKNDFQKFNFHEKIFIEKQKIKEAILNYKN